MCVCVCALHILIHSLNQHTFIEHLVSVMHLLGIRDKNDEQVQGHSHVTTWGKADNQISNDYAMW